MMNSDHLIESEAQHESGLHHRETINNAHIVSDGLKHQYVRNGSVGSNDSNPDNIPRKRHVRGSAGNVRIDVDDKYKKYGRRRRKKHNSTAFVGVIICIVSFLLGFVWMHFTREEPSQPRPQLRHAASKTFTERWKPHNINDAPYPEKQQLYNDKPPKVNKNSLFIPRFDTRKYVHLWEKNARNAALQQANSPSHPQSIHVEGWNVPIAFRTFPYARQTHGPIKNIDSDYGGLTYRSLKNADVFARVIADDDEGDDDSDKVVPGAFDPDSINPDVDLRKRNAKKRRMKVYPKLDSNGNKVLKTPPTFTHLQTYYDDDSVHVLPRGNDGKTRSPRACQKAETSHLYFPTCNNFHEHDLGRVYDDPSLLEHPRPENEMYQKYLAHGYYRDVWILEDNPWIWPHRYPNEKLQKQPKYGVENEERTAEMVPKAYRSAALKTLQLTHKFSQDHFEEVQNEAVIMERLTSSPRIMNIYGHCVMSTMAEVVPIEFEEVAVPGEGYFAHDEIEERNKNGVRPFNNFTPTQKLGFALEMAESLADLHGFPDGVIVHDDVQPCQWLRTPDGHLKLGDFNRATIMQWDNVAGGYCKFNNGEAFANYRAPEEFAARNLDEQIDVFSFGNNLYGMMTGLWNFYDTDDDDKVQTKIIDGEIPFIDPRYRERSFADRTLVDLMKRCWVYDPAERISIFEAVDILKKAVEDNGKEEAVREKE